MPSVKQNYKELKMPAPVSEVAVPQVEMSDRLSRLISDLVVTHEHLCDSMIYVTSNRPEALDLESPSCHKHALELLETISYALANVADNLKRELK
jgi:hypothetical protein